MKTRNAWILPIFALCLAHNAGAANLEIGTKGDELSFDKSTLAAKVGESVELTFKNNATPDSAMSHSWVLVHPGKAESVANAAASAGPDKNFVPENPDVIAHTRLLKPGQTDTIRFKAPQKPGDYPYLCTVPGHYPSLKGVLKVTK